MTVSLACDTSHDDQLFIDTETAPRTPIALAVAASVSAWPAEAVPLTGLDASASDTIAGAPSWTAGVDWLEACFLFLVDEVIPNSASRVFEAQDCCCIHSCIVH
jgi:hypothetical protein